MFTLVLCILCFTYGSICTVWFVNFLDRRDNKKRLRQAQVEFEKYESGEIHPIQYTN